MMATRILSLFSPLVLLIAVLASLCVHRVHRTGAWGLVTTHPRHHHLHLHLQHSSAQTRAAKTTWVLGLSRRSSAAEAAWHFRLRSTTASEGGVSGDEGKKKKSKIYQRWEGKKRALLAYKSKYGNLRVPQTFTIPVDDSSWEQDLRGVKLGSTVRDIRSNNRYSAQKQELEEMGFEYEPQLQRYGWEVVKRALLAYESNKGNLRVPRTFSIPVDDASWEQDLWGMKLGFVVYNIRNKNAYSNNKQELLAMGFDYLNQNIRRWERTKKALLA
jgi:hypothetical protein